MIDPAAKLAAIDDMIAHSRRKLEELEAKAKAVQDESEEEMRLCKRLMEEKDNAAHAVQHLHNGHHESGRGVGVPAKIVQILLEKRLPMRATEIARELGELGVVTQSTKGLLPNVISALTRRKDLFRRIGRGTYELCQ